MAKKKLKLKVELRKDNKTGELVEPTELEQVQAEIAELSPRLKDIQTNDPENYTKIYAHFLWLIERRDQLKGQ